MVNAYQTMPNAYWKEHHIETLLNKFPEGQVVVKVNGIIAGCALSIMVDAQTFDEDQLSPRGTQ